MNVARGKAGKLPATNVWLWGLGQRRALQPFAEVYGPRGAMITAVDLLRGHGGADRLGADRSARRDRLSRHRLRRQGPRCASTPSNEVRHRLRPRRGTDEASHEGRCDEKVKALEEIDRHIVGPLLAALETHGD